MSCPLTRLTALVTAALGALVAVELAGAASAERYAVLLVTVVVAGTLGAAWRMWSRCTLDVRLAAGGLAGVILVGQVLVSWQGGPGGTALPWRPTGVAVAALAAVVLLLVAAAPRPVESDDHPYAL